MLLNKQLSKIPSHQFFYSTDIFVCIRKHKSCTEYTRGNRSSGYCPFPYSSYMRRTSQVCTYTYFKSCVLLYMYSHIRPNTNCQIASRIAISVLLRRNNNAVVAYSSLPRTTRSLGATPQYSLFNLFSSAEAVPKPHFIIFAVYFRC